MTGRSRRTRARRRETSGCGDRRERSQENRSPATAIAS
jgi:hypothetical protein